MFLVESFDTENTNSGIKEPGSGKSGNQRFSQLQPCQVNNPPMTSKETKEMSFVFISTTIKVGIVFIFD